MPIVNFSVGSDQTSHSWAKFYVRGLEKWQVRVENADYQKYTCLNVPVGTIFTIYCVHGDNHGTKDIRFYICEVIRQEYGCSEINSMYDRTRAYNRSCNGDFEILLEGKGKTKAPRLLGWWDDFLKSSPDASEEAKKSFIAHCQRHLAIRGLKLLPKMESNNLCQ
jgi:hypothetical protein